MVDCDGLENRWSARARGFESHPLRHHPHDGGATRGATRGASSIRSAARPARDGSLTIGPGAPFNPHPVAGRWQSGRLRQIANLLTGVLLRPRVQIPPCPPSPAPRRRAALAAALLLAAVALPGCVSRKLFLKTEPPGAVVFLDGARAGVTPYEGELPAYGTRRVEFDLPGYRRRVELLELAWPWWQYVPLDMVTDLLVPWTIEDHREFSFALEAVDPEQATWDDARAARERMQSMQAGLPAADPAPAGGAEGGG